MDIAPPEVPRKAYVFLSHAGADTHAARQFAEVLRHNGLEVWFDKDNLQPGDNWMAALEEAIARASAMIVYVGTSGIQAWVDREVRFGLVRNTANREAYRFIPVLGEGADVAKLPPFVQQQQCVHQHDPEQIRRLIETLRNGSLPQNAIPADYWTTHTPFRSLQIFGPEDSWLFFGRDRDTDELLTRLGRAPTLAVIGNSGSGKSSLIQAGLIPALRRGRFRYGGKWVDSWRVAVFRPSIAPFDYLAEALPGQLAPELSASDRAEFTGYCKRKLPQGGDTLRNSIAALLGPADQTSADVHVLLVADQFEELFTLVQDQATRSRYIEALLLAAGMEGAVPVHLVLALRADFYGHCLEHPNLGAVLDTNTYNVPGMTPAQLKQAIENRLALAGASAEAGLIDSLLADVGAEPGNLALLEHALAQLWQKCGGSGRALSGDAYAEIGRLKGALGRHADEVYRGLGGEADRQLAQQIFLELVQLGDGAQDTRRRVPKQALLHLGAREQVERVIAELASKRLVATGGQGHGSLSEDFVEVSHEALIREWPLLREWLKGNREDLRLRRLLEQAAEEWQELKRDPGALIQGVRLVQGREWLSKHTNVPTLVAEFLKAGIDAEEASLRKEREAQEREIARQKEFLRQAEARAEAEERLRVTEETAAVRARRSAVRSRRFSYGLGALVLIAAGAAIFARSQQLTAQSRALAAQAEQMMVRDPPAALTLAIRSWHTGKTAEANLALAHAFPQLLTKLEGHTGYVWQGAFSPDGQRIVTAALDGTARLWNAANGQLLVKLEGDAKNVWETVFSPDGQRIVTSGESAARVWNVADGRLLATLQGYAIRFRHAAFSPDGRRILTVGEDTVGVWNGANGQLLARLEGHTGKVEYAAFSPDGQRVVTAGYDHTARVWQAASGQFLFKLEGHTGYVVCAVFSPDGQRILTASVDQTARVWSARNGQPLMTLAGHTSVVRQAVFSPDGQRILTASADHTARIWQAASGHLLAKLEGHTDNILHAAFSPDGQRIVTASADRTARVWNARNGQLLARLEGHTAEVWYAAFSGDGLRILTTSSDLTARVWNLASVELMATLEGNAVIVWQAAFSSDGQRILTTGDNTAHVWNAANGQLMATLAGHTEVVGQAAFSPDGRRVVTASSDHTARVWKTAGGQLLVKLEGHTDYVVHAVFSPDGQRIVTASWDDTARVWNASTGQLLAKLEGHTDDVVQAAFSPDGQHIVTASRDHTARIWNAYTGQLLARLEGHQEAVWQAMFSPNGQSILTASDDGTACIWNASTGQLLARMEGHEGNVREAAFSPDGQRVVTGSGDHTARIWKAASGQLLAKLEGHTDEIMHTEFSPDGQRIVTASADHTARVWNAANGQVLVKLEGHTDSLENAAYSPDGQRIATAGEHTARVYRVVTLSELAELLGK